VFDEPPPNLITTQHDHQGNYVMTNETPSYTPEDPTEISKAELSDRPELSPNIVHRWPLIVAAIVIIGVMAGACALSVFLYNNADVAQRVRDLAIILVAISNLVIILVLTLVVIVLLYLILKIYDISVLAGRELRLLLKKLDETASLTKDTAQTLQNRAVFIGDEAVKPVVTVISTYAAIKAILRALFGRR
jgi:hypothetical protein